MDLNLKSFSAMKLELTLLANNRLTSNKLSYQGSTAVKSRIIAQHKDVALCSIGALAFYLTLRFYVIREFHDMTLEGWLGNSSWFDIKLLTDIQGDPTKEMKNNMYARHIKGMLEKLSLVCGKILHLGRNLGAKILDLLQEEESAINAMGNWAQTIRRTCYSSQLPMAPMKGMAGFEDGKFYILTRGEVKPPEDLQHMTPIGEWSYNALEQVQCVAEHGKHKTAIKLLQFMCDLDNILLQDSAAMLLKYPDRGQHLIFKDLPVFSSSKWDSFKDKMEHELENEEIPLQVSMETVLPGLQAWQQSNHNSI